VGGRRGGAPVPPPPRPHDVGQWFSGSQRTVSWCTLNLVSSRAEAIMTSAATET
jgi:hypothetical protein